ncbi:hypothetical protein MJ581_15670 [Escherichia coli]|nr:hypothetical protein MJ581_15670 [Escherichia coli]
MTNPTLQFDGDIRQHINGKTHLCSHCQFDYRYCHIDHLINSHFDYSLMSMN